jgi:4-hydroxy-tetrahydrodipicolinate reductase
MNPIRIALNGACGRMGRILVDLIDADETLELAAVVEASGHPHLGGTLGVDALTITDGFAVEADVMVDFSLPDGTMACLPVCVERRLPMVIGTTGLTPQQTTEIAGAAKTLPIVFAPNMSVGVNLLLSLVGEVAKALGEGYDCEIVEMHHRFKKDAPSGTALKLAERIAEATGRVIPDDAVFGRRGEVGERPPREIGIHAVRGGDVVGEHTVSFATAGERIELVHKASSRETFARGALRAARWLAGKDAGLYTMLDVLGL